MSLLDTIETIADLLKSGSDALNEATRELGQLKAALRAEPEIDTSATDATEREYGDHGTDPA